MLPYNTFSFQWSMSTFIRRERVNYFHVTAFRVATLPPPLSLSLSLSLYIYIYIYVCMYKYQVAASSHLPKHLEELLLV